MRKKCPNRQPYVAKCDTDPGIFKCPNFRGYRPKKWKLTETYFVDNSGFGRDNEPALTAKQFVEHVKAGCGYAVIASGQFQVFVGEFMRFVAGKDSDGQTDCDSCGANIKNVQIDEDTVLCRKCWTKEFIKC